MDELTASVNWGAIMAKVFARFKFVADVPAALLDTVAKPATTTLHTVVEAVSGHKLCRPQPPRGVQDAPVDQCRGRVGARRGRASSCGPCGATGGA
jgi:hypothetical protein